MKAFESSAHHLKRVKHRNELAAIQSIIPGLGHIYKGYVGMGLSLMIMFPVIVYAGIVMAFATAGVGLFLPIAYMLIVGWHAFTIDDRRKHHAGLL